MTDMLKAASSVTTLWSFLAMAIIAIGTFVVRLRVNRFRELLKHIEHIPEGERTPILQSEMHTVIPPTMTPEQFIAFKRQPYNFLLKCLIVVLIAGLLSIILFNFGAYRLYIAPFVTHIVSPTSGSPSPNSNNTLASFLPSSWHEKDDPLSDNSQGYGWEEGLLNLSRSCQFSHGDYQIGEIGFGGASGYAFCLAQNMNYSDFAFAVQLKLPQATGGGIVFRAGPNGEDYFSVGNLNNMTILLFVKDCPGPGSSSFSCRTLMNFTSNQLDGLFHKGPNDWNSLAVVARGNHFVFFVNEQEIQQLTANTYSQREIGLGVGMASSEFYGSSDEMRNAKIWTP